MKKILVLGGYSGIAQAVLNILVSQEVTLYLVGRDEQKLQIVKDHLSAYGKSKVILDVFDLNNIQQHKDLLDRAIQQMNGLDILFVCYGILPNQRNLEEEPEMSINNYMTNAISTINFVSLAANYFEEKNQGTIAVVTSVAGDRGRKSNYFYGSAKACVDTFLEGLRHRLFRKNVHIITIKPGLVDTPMVKDLEKKILVARPERVARDIVNALDAKKKIVYTPSFFRFIMLIVKLLPRSIFYRLNV